MSPWYYSQLESLARAFEFSLDVPVKDMEKQDLDRVLYGTKRKRIDVQHHTRRGKTYRWRTAFEGVINNLERRYKDTESDHVRSEIERYMSTNPCSACKGEKLRPEARAVTVCGINIMDVTNKSIAQASAWIAAIGGDRGQQSVLGYQSPRPKPSPRGRQAEWFLSQAGVEGIEWDGEGCEGA